MTGKWLGKAGWLEAIRLFLVWFHRGVLPRKTRALPSLQNGEAEIKALEYPLPSRRKIWKYFLVEKTELLCSRNGAGRPAAMRNPGARRMPILGEVLPPGSFSVMAGLPEVCVWGRDTIFTFRLEHAFNMQNVAGQESHPSSFDIGDR